MLLKILLLLLNRENCGCNSKGRSGIIREINKTDEGASYLGEVALVPHNSPISNSQLLFFNTLFDENASNHLAIGSAYPTCLEGGQLLSEEERKS